MSTEKTITTTEVVPTTVTRTTVEKSEGESGGSGADRFLLAVLVALVLFALCGHARPSWHGGHQRGTYHGRIAR